jgi:tetratricopeptide (TPR) repeat protein
MHRSAVKSGMHVQRSRASTRRRDRGEAPAHSPDAQEQLRAWLKGHVRLDSVQDIKALDRKRFLQETGRFDVPPGERLRRLAIHLEDEAAVANQPDGWCALRAIYDHALRFNEPEDWVVYNSLAISALEMLWRPEEAPPVRQRIADEGVAAAARAVELAPHQARTHYWLGRWYCHLGQLAEALRCAEAGVAVDAKHGWSALLRADLLSDLHRWEEAIEAYNAVGLDFFKGHDAWRVDWLKECRAWCRLQQGDRDGARADFLASLSRYEANIGLAERVDPTHLVDAAAGPLREELHERTLALVRRLDFRWYVEDLEVPPMTESQWLTGSDPRALLQFLERGTTRRTLGARLTRRKQVLLALRRGAQRLEGRPPGSDLEGQAEALMRQAAELAERLVEGEVAAAQLAEVRMEIERLRAADPAPTDPINPIPDLLHSVSSLVDFASGETDLLDLVTDRREPHAFRIGSTAQGADLVREVFGNPFRRAGIVPEWLTWNDGAVRHLARTIDEELAFGLMPVLADALQEAGCTDEAVLQHCRENTGHFRGCWVVDEILGKDR